MARIGMWLKETLAMAMTLICFSCVNDALKYLVSMQSYHGCCGIAHKRSLPFIDVYPMSTAFYPNAGHELYAHYYYSNDI